MRRRVALVVLVLVAIASLSAGCSKDDGGGASETTVTTLDGPPTDAKSRQKAFDADERALSTIRLPGAVGVFAKSSKVCPKGKAPQITRTDESSLEPADVKTQLTTDLEGLGWQHEELPDGNDLYTKEPYQLLVEMSASDGGTTAELQVTSNLAACP